VNEKDKIRILVRKLLTANGDTGPLGDQDSLLLSGRLQSIDIVEIVMFLDQNYGIDITQIEFEREQIDSIDAIHLLTNTAPSQIR
jgi:acyl carrier protein